MSYRREDGAGRHRGDFEYACADYKPFEVYATPLALRYSVSLFGPIEDASQFIDAIHALRSAGEEDVVEIDLQTPGGSIDATDVFLQAMLECEGRVVIHASGGVHSCGSIIMMHATEFTLSQHFNMLIHNGATGAGGDFNKFVAAAKHSESYMAKVLRSSYAGFLTPEEIEAMLDGKDFYLDSNEFMRRWHVRDALLKAKDGSHTAES